MTILPVPWKVLDITEARFGKDWLFECGLDIMPNWGFLVNILNLNLKDHMLTHAYGRRERYDCDYGEDTNSIYLNSLIF